MKMLVLTVAIMLSGVAQQPPVACDHTAWIAASLKQIQAIKPGMTRQDLLKVFTAEGGLSNRLGRTYVFHDCPFIKADVDFRPAGGGKDMLHESPADIVTAISRPYLNWSVAD